MGLPYLFVDPLFVLGVVQVVHVVSEGVVLVVAGVLKEVVKATGLLSLDGAVASLDMVSDGQNSLVFTDKLVSLALPEAAHIHAVVVDVLLLSIVVESRSAGRQLPPGRH